MIINPNPVRLKVVELDVVAIRTNVSIDFRTIVKDYYFPYFFSDFHFSSLEYIVNSLMLLIE